jgi:hypothetical protein
MKEELQQAWQDVQAGWAPTDGQSILVIALYLIVAGVLGIYLRFLYGRCGAYASDADPITRVFPLLTIVTTGVIAVVKSSLALSLGLVGALSIVRFRAAIKEPEELVYLFMCIAIGLSLGASQPLLAAALVVVATVYVVGMHRFGRSVSTQRMMLTVTGDSERHFQSGESNVMSTVEKTVSGPCRLHRISIENGRGEVRIMLPKACADEVAGIVMKLRTALPDCEFSYVDVHASW